MEEGEDKGEMVAVGVPRNAGAWSVGVFLMEIEPVWDQARAVRAMLVEIDSEWERACLKTVSE